jgi:hypothetical protein
MSPLGKGQSETIAQGSAASVHQTIMNHPSKQSAANGGVPLGHQIIAQKQYTYLGAFRHLTAVTPTAIWGKGFVVFRM